jgi:hypothetical protein
VGGFVLGYGVVGLWVGLCVGLTLVGLFLLSVWRRRIGDLRRDPSKMASLDPESVHL